jgi:hypothetical protein
MLTIQEYNPSMDDPNDSAIGYGGAFLALLALALVLVMACLTFAV